MLCWINFPCPFEVPCNEVNCNLSVIWKKGQSQNGVTRKQSTLNYPKTQTFLTTWYAHARVRIRELKNLFVFFFGKFDMLCFLVIFAFRFALLPYCRRFFHATHNFKYILALALNDKHWSIKGTFIHSYLV